jgi:hypothetical protein
MWMCAHKTALRFDKEGPAHQRDVSTPLESGVAMSADRPDSLHRASARCLTIVPHCVMQADCITHYFWRLFLKIVEAFAVFSIHLPKASTYRIGQSIYRFNPVRVRGSDFLLRKSRVPRERSHTSLTRRHITCPPVFSATRQPPPRTGGRRRVAEFGVRVRQGSGFHTMAELFPRRERGWSKSVEGGTFRLRER